MSERAGDTAEAQQNLRCKMCGQIFQSEGKLREHTEQQHYETGAVTSHTDERPAGTA